MVDYKPYSMALFELADNETVQMEWMKGLEEIVEVFKTVPQMKQIFSHPKISTEKKKEILSAAFEKDVDPTLYRFLLVLNAHRVVAHIEEIYQMYMACYKEAHAIELVHVKSASSLSKEQVKRLQDMLEKKLDKKVELDLEIDPSLIAGMVVQGKDFVMNNTISSRIKTMKEKLNR